MVDVIFGLDGGELPEIVVSDEGSYSDVVFGPLETTVYLDAAVRQLRAQGYPVLDADMARLSPFVRRHLGVHGTYSFVLPDLAPGAIRELRNPGDPEEDDD
jgi:hypothetical protein